MERKYEFTGETKIAYGATLHRIRAVQNIETTQGTVLAGSLGGWIESEENLSHYDGCWVADEAIVHGNAHVCINGYISEQARISGQALVSMSAHVYGRAFITENARIYGDARVYDYSAIYNSQIFGNAHIYGSAQVYGSAKIYDKAQIFEDAEIYGQANIRDDAMIFGSSEVFGAAIIGEFGYIRNSKDYITIGPLGSRDDITTFYLTPARKIMVCCGCFTGSIDEFRAAVTCRHNGTIYEDEYFDAIEYATKQLLRSDNMK